MFLFNTITADVSLIDSLIKCLPFLTVLVALRINRFIMTKTFLNRTSTILALENFRAFNVYLYFFFYYDCFRGLLKAIMRLLKANVSTIFMMPSKFYNNYSNSNELLSVTVPYLIFKKH